LLAGLAGWSCWPVLLAGLAGRSCWPVLLAGLAGQSCWPVLLASPDGWSCWPVLYWLVLLTGLAGGSLLAGLAVFFSTRVKYIITYFKILQCILFSFQEQSMQENAK
jgi:hypothetical protein